MTVEIVHKNILKLCQCRIIWYLLPCFTIIIMCYVHSVRFMKNVSFPKIWFVKTSTRIVKYESWVIKSIPGDVSEELKPWTFKHTSCSLMCFKWSCFSDFWKILSVVPAYAKVGEGPIVKNYHLYSFLSVGSKVFGKFVNNKLVDHLKDCGLFPDFHYGFGSFQSTADFLIVASDSIAWGFNKSVANRTVAFHYLRLLAEFGRLVFFTNSSLIEFQIEYLALFYLFSLINSFLSFWMESLCKNIQLMLEFTEVPVLVLHFCCSILMTFLLMLSAILVSMLMILPSTLSVSVSRDLICGNSYSRLLNLNLTNKTLYIDWCTNWLNGFSTGTT